jgi:hypothetical protein
MTTMDEASRALIHYAHLLTHYVDTTAHTFRRIPGSHMFVRYIRLSYQNDPVRTGIELALVLFCLVYVLKQRFSTDANRVGLGLSEEEIDELVGEWTPEPLVAPLTQLEKEGMESGAVIIG